MTGSQTFPSLTRESLDQHQQIHFFLDQLARSLQGLEGGPPQLETIRRLAAQIEGLRERLQEHFSGEEDGGLFRAIQDLLPDSRAEIQRLSQDHARILEMLELTRIHVQFGEPAQAAALRTETEALLEVLRDHETREEALLARALERDGRP